MGAIRTLLVAVVSLGIAEGREPQSLSVEDLRIITALPEVPPGLNESDALEIQPSKSVNSVHTYTVRAPGLTATEWVLFTPRPPDLAGQRILDAATTPGNENVFDISPLKQPLMRARAPVKATGQTKQITFESRVEAKLFTRRLIHRVGNTPETPAIMLSARERQLFLRRTPQFDYASRALRAWMNSNQLQRAKDEGEVDFARRVFLVIARSFHYEYLGEQNRSAPHVCAAGKSDCGGLAVLFATILRSQGIPTRTLAGRWAISAKPEEKIGLVKYHQEHVKAEFFAQGVGWVPVDLSSAILHDRTPAKLEFFGNDKGDFLTLHFDNDLVIDTLFFGERRVSLLQRPAFWVSGSGSVDKAVIRESWTVTDQLPRAVPAE